MENSKNINKSKIRNKKVANKLYINLLECSDAVKTASQNGTVDFQIEENLKSETRRSYRLINMIYLLISVGITYYLSFLSPLAIIIPLFTYYHYIVRHPSFQLLKLWFLEGTSLNQIRVIYYQIFKHLVNVKYIVIIGIILFSVSITHYFYNFSNYNISIFITNNIFEILNQEFGNNLIKFYQQIEDELNISVKTLYLFLGFSMVREVSANINAFSITVIIFFNVVQILRRPK